MPAFDEVRFPDDISKGSAGGPERRTDIVTLASGYEERNAVWRNSRRRYDASLGLRDIDDLHDVIEFFEARNGRLIAFRWKDWSDYKSCKPGENVSSTDQLIGVGDGAQTEFQLIKRYSSGGREYVRDIAKPVSGTELLNVNGLDTTAYTIDLTTGLVTFTSAPANGHQIKAGYQFDVPVRFDQDSISVSVDAFEAGSLPALNLVEVRL